MPKKLSEMKKEDIVIMQKEINKRLRKKYKLNNQYKGDISNILKTNHYQDIYSILLLNPKHPLVNAARKVIKDEQNKKQKNNEKRKAAEKKKKNNSGWKLEAIPGGGKCTTYTAVWRGQP